MSEQIFQPLLSRGFLMLRMEVTTITEFDKSPNGVVNKKITLHRGEVQYLRFQADKKLASLIEAIIPKLSSCEKKSLGKVVYPEEPFDENDNPWEADIIAGDEILEINGRSLRQNKTNKTTIPRSELKTLIYEVHPKVIVDLAKNVEEKKSS